jgi:hypothetical protein
VQHQHVTCNEQIALLSSRYAQPLAVIRSVPCWTQDEPESDWKQALKGGVAYSMPVASRQPGTEPWGSTAQGAELSAEQKRRLRRRHIVFRDLYDRG